MILHEHIFSYYSSMAKETSDLLSSHCKHKRGYSDKSPKQDAIARVCKNPLLTFILLTDVLCKLVHKQREGI